MAKTVAYKSVIRTGPSLSEMREEEGTKHLVIVMIKYLEMKNEYEVVVTYTKDEGYKVKLTNSHKNKLDIKDCFSEQATSKGFVMKLKKK